MLAELLMLGPSEGLWEEGGEGCPGQAPGRAGAVTLSSHLLVASSPPRSLAFPGIPFHGILSALCLLPGFVFSLLLSPLKKLSDKNTP